MIYKIPFCVFILGISSLAFGEDKYIQNYHTILNRVLQNANPKILPRPNNTSPLKVDLGLSMHSILDVDLRNQIFLGTFTLKMVWNDPRLTWDNNTEELDYIQVKPGSIWMPDIDLSNAAEKSQQHDTSLLKIWSNGDVKWTPKFLFKSQCTIDVTYYPFDQQVCVLKFGSSSYAGDEMTLELLRNMNFVDTSEFYLHVAYDLIEAPAYINVYDQDGYKDINITYYVTIRRKHLNPCLQIVLPSILLGVLIALVHLLPLSPVRAFMSVIILITQLISIHHILGTLPPTSLVMPLIVDYLVFLTFLQTVSLSITAVLLRLGNEQKIFPSAVSKLIARRVPWFSVHENNGETATEKLGKNGVHLMDFLLFLVVTAAVIIKTIIFRTTPPY